MDLQQAQPLIVEDTGALMASLATDAPVSRKADTLCQVKSTLPGVGNLQAAGAGGPGRILRTSDSQWPFATVLSQKIAPRG